MKQYWIAILIASALAASAGSADATVITLTDAQQMALADLGWGPGTPPDSQKAVLVSKVEVPGTGDLGVDYTVTFATTGDGKFAYGNWGGNYADWRPYNGFALKFDYVSTQATQPGTIWVNNFTGTSGWSYRQPYGAEQEVALGGSKTMYIDFASCYNGESPPGPSSMSATDLNKVCGAGWQVITHDPNMLGKTIVLRVTPSTVPEPATLTLLGLGGLCCVGLWWRRRKAAD